MLIPNKHSGYRAGIRLYPGGGGGGGGGGGDGGDGGVGGDAGGADYSSPAPSGGGSGASFMGVPITPTNTLQNPTPAPAPAPAPWANLGVNTQQGYNTLMQTQAPGTSGMQKGALYNSMLGMGFNDSAIRSSADALFGRQSDSDWNTLVQYGGMQSPTGRPLSGSGQFYQPVYQPQYQNYSMTNPFSVSQYNRALSPFDSYYAQNPDVGRAFTQNTYGMGGEQFAQSHYQNYGRFEGRAAPTAAPMGFYNPYAMQTPFNPYSNGFQTPFSFGGYGGFTPQSAPTAPRTSSGPSSAIVSRSSALRGTPPVMGGFAEGGIAGLLK